MSYTCLSPLLAVLKSAPALRKLTTSVNKMIHIYSQLYSVMLTFRHIHSNAYLPSGFWKGLLTRPVLFTLAQHVITCSSWV